MSDTNTQEEYKLKHGWFSIQQKVNPYNLILILYKLLCLIIFVYWAAKCLEEYLDQEQKSCYSS